MSANAFEKVEEVKGPVAKNPDDWMFVTIPEADLFDQQHPAIQLNRTRFEPGHIYKVPAAIGEEVERRLAMFNKEQVRLLRPNTDKRALKSTVVGNVPLTTQSHDAIMASLGPNDKVITISEL